MGSMTPGLQSDLTVTRRLAGILARPVGTAERARAVLHLLDWTGCALAAADAPAAKAMRDALSNEKPGAARLAGSGRSVSPLTACLINGTMGNILEMDDVDRQAILHPGPTVIPAALAAAASTRASASDLLDAIVRGYEAVIRIGRSVGRGHYAYWHNTGTCGPFGAAAAAASVFGLGAEETISALGLAGTQASGFWQTRHEPDSLAKQLHTARAAHAGLLAAQLAVNGFQGPRTILEGEQGFFAATCPDGRPDDVLADEGADWLIHEVSFKPWPACRHAHATIDAALDLADKVAADAIERVQVETYEDALKFCDRAEPSSVLEAKFSLQHSAAVCLSGRRPELADFELDAVAALGALRGKVGVAATAEFQDPYPAHYGASVRVTLKDGTTVSATRRDAWGDPENPLSQTDIIAKAKRLMVHGGLSAAAAEEVVESCLALETGGSLTRFAAGFSGAGEVA